MVKAKKKNEKNIRKDINTLKSEMLQKYQTAQKLPSYPVLPIDLPVLAPFRNTRSIRIVVSLPLQCLFTCLFIYDRSKIVAIRVVDILL